RRAALLVMAGRGEEARRDLRAADAGNALLLVLRRGPPLTQRTPAELPAPGAAGAPVRSLYCHGNRRFVVFLPAPARRFTAVARVDLRKDGARPDGVVDFQVFAAGKRLAYVRAKPGGPGAPVTADLRGMTAFTLDTYG